MSNPTNKPISYYICTDAYIRMCICVYVHMDTLAKLCNMYRNPRIHTERARHCKTCMTHCVLLLFTPRQAARAAVSNEHDRGEPLAARRTRHLRKRGRRQKRHWRKPKQLLSPVAGVAAPARDFRRNHHVKTVFAFMSAAGTTIFVQPHSQSRVSPQNLVSNRL